MLGERTEGGSWMLRVCVVCFVVLGWGVSLVGCGGKVEPNCTADLDCKELGYVCKEKVCVLNDDKLCPNFCSRDEECIKCNSERTSCMSNRCVKPKQSVDYERCGQEEGLCGEKATCAILDRSVKHGYCLPSCDLASKTCMEGKGNCVGSGAQGVCMPKGTGKEGESCKFDPNATKKITGSIFCEEGLHCVEDRCQKPTEVGKNQECGVAGRVCKKELSCTQVAAGNFQGYCVTSCDPAQKECEGGAGSCLKLTNGKGSCFPKGQAAAEAVCGPKEGSKELDPARICKEGLSCVSGKCKAPQVVAHFHKCDAMNLCAKDAHCVQVRAELQHGYCLPVCVKSGDACDGGGGKCQPLSDGSLVCIREGTAAVDGLCGFQPSDETMESKRICKPGLRCIVFSQESPFGYCLGQVQQCSATACEKGRVCLSLSGGGVCAQDCGGGQSCSSSGRCQQLQSGEQAGPSVCIPK